MFLAQIPTFGGISRPLFTQRWRSWKTGWIYFRAPLRLDGNWSEAFVVKKTGKNWVIYGSSTFPMDVVQKVDNPKKLDNPKKVMDLVQKFSTTCQRNRTSNGTRFSANQRWLHSRRWRRRGESQEFTRKSVAETGWTWGADESWDYLTSEYSGVIGISWGCNSSIYIYIIDIYIYIYLFIICIYIYRIYICIYIIYICIYILYYIDINYRSEFKIWMRILMWELIFHHMICPGLSGCAP